MPRILVVEDDAHMRGLIGRLLRQAGHDAVLAEDGRRGVEAFRRAAPDLVIIDMLMPEMEGIETIREIHNLRAEVPVIAISGGGDLLLPQDVLSLAAKLGACATIEKPFEPADLTDCVSRCLAHAA